MMEIMMDNSPRGRIIDEKGTLLVKIDFSFSRTT